jgi:glutaredoxin
MILRRFLLVLIAFAGVAQAQQYRWTDEKGRRQFGDTPPPGAKDVRKSEVVTAKPAPEALPFELTELQKNFPVTVYTAPICKEPCQLARDLLNKRGVPFNEIQVWTPETLEQLKNAANTENVPALVVGRSALSGFDSSQYNALLDSAGYPAAGQYPARSQAAPAAPEGFKPPPVAEPVAPSAPEAKPGPYDPSGLTGPAPRLGPYDTGGLPATPQKPGPYGTPADGK